jgi:predicted phosphodiesterase
MNHNAYKWYRRSHPYIISFYLLLTLAPLTGHGKILMTPWLQSVTTSSIYILVECDKKDTVIISYGQSPSYGFKARTANISSTTASPATYVHKVLLKGLSPNTTYYYKARQGIHEVAGATFQTAVEPGTPFRLGWMADFRTGLTIHDTISKLIRKQNPRILLYGGDLCMNGTYKSWKEEFFRTEELKVISEIPFVNVFGNHEGTGQNSLAFLQNPVSASRSQLYYSFDYGDLHVLCLNTQISLTKGSPQYDFAVADLAGTRRTWKIVVCHSPAYCAGGHGENSDLIGLSKAVFLPNHVAMVISGHSHFYQHNLVDGIHHLIIGSAGAPLYKPEKAGYTMVSAMEYNYAVFDISPDSLSVKVLNEKNKELDSLHLTRNTGR